MATSVLPSPVFISAIFPWWSTAPPISWTSKCRMFEDAPARLAYDGKGFRQQIVERLAFREPLAEFGRSSREAPRRNAPDCGFERADLAHDRAQTLQFSVVLGADDLGEEGLDHL